MLRAGTSDAGEGRRSATPLSEMSSSTMAYSGLIAAISSTSLEDEWFISQQGPGTFYQLEYYGGLNMDQAVFYEGSQLVNDTIFSVDHIAWDAWRVNTPICDWETASLTLAIGYYSCYPQGGSPTNHKPDYFGAEYRVAAVPPPTLSIQSSEANDSDYFWAWGTVTTNPSGSPVASYSWQTSPNGVNWTQWSGTQYNYTASSMIGTFAWAGTPLHVRLTVTLTNGQQSSRTHTFYY